MTPTKQMAGVRAYLARARMAAAIAAVAVAVMPVSASAFHVGPSKNAPRLGQRAVRTVAAASTRVAGAAAAARVNVGCTR